MEKGKEYYAFISYKREDEKWAKWLQNKLEHYKFPTNLNGRTDLPKSIRPTFRDVTDLKPGLLAEEINKAICNSEWLIVVCSPRSAKSPWVCKETQTFIDLGRADHIIPFVIEGNPFSNDTATECYPEALLNLTGSKELLAANINEMGRDAAAIKVVARMFNLRFDALWQRYGREQRLQRRKKIGLALSGVSILAIVSFIFAIIVSGKNTQLANANAGMMKNRAHFVSQEAMQLISRGDTYRAILLLLEVLPDSDHPDRPLIAETERALRVAMDSLNKEGYVPIAHLDFHDDRAFYYENIQNVYYDPDKKNLWVQFHISDDSGNRINCYNIQNGALLGSYDELESEEYETIENMCNFTYDRNDTLSAQYFYEEKMFKLEVFDRHCVLYKRKANDETIISYELPIGPTERFDKSVFSHSKSHMIIGDTIYNYLTGKSVRGVGIPGYTSKDCIYSSDDEYIIAKNDSIFSIEEVQTGKILNKLNYKMEYNIEDDYSIYFFSKNGSLCISHGVENPEYDIFTLPDLKHVYQGKNYQEFYKEQDYVFDYDCEKEMLLMKNAKDNSHIRTIHLDLSFVRNNYDYYDFELLDDHTLFIGGMVGRMMIYDLDKDAIERKCQYSGDRYEGGIFSSKKDCYLTWNIHGDVSVYDPYYGEILYSYSSSEDILKYSSAMHGYECSFSGDEKYIVYMIENNVMEYYTWSVVVIKWNSLDDIITRAKKEISGRELSVTEKRNLYIE